MNKISVYGDIRKAEEQDDGTLCIEGIASAEVVDSAGETILASAMKAAIPGFLGKAGVGALREMHQNIAAGRVDSVTVDDDTGETRIVGTVVDPGTIRKVKASVLRGLSVGGRVLARDKKNPKIITKVDWTELSCVERPCCSAAVILAKATPAAPLGQKPVAGGTNDMAPVVSVGSLSQEDVAAYLAQLSNEDRAALLIHAIMRAGLGRRY
jgi:hypothetical protein